MKWVREKEEWLADWSDAKCLKEISFEHTDGPHGQHPASGDVFDVFFSDVIEAAGRCLVCRASGTIVDVFDISPAAESLISWRIWLPSPVVPDIGIAHACGADGALLCVMFLTKALVIHAVRISLHHPLPEMLIEGSTDCNLSSQPSPPSSFCALDGDLVALGCFNGTIHVIRLGQAHATYEFTDVSLVRRIINGFLQPTVPVALALACVGLSSSAAFGSGFRVLSFSTDGKLRLWEALQNRGNLLASRAALPSAQDHMTSLIGASSAYMRVSPSKTRACLVLRNTVHVIDLPAAGNADGFVVREIKPPFPSATPSLVALSHATLWSFWSGHSREQLFHISLEEFDSPTWRARALDAGLLSADTAARCPALARAVMEGCDGASVPILHQNVFTMHQQQEVWRAEEDGFDPFQITEMLDACRQRETDGHCAELVDIGFSYNESFDRDTSTEDVVLHWWLSRIFTPGRYSSSVIMMALHETGGRLLQEPDMPRSGVLRSAIEEHLRRQVAMRKGNSSSSHQVVAVLASAASEFLGTCDTIWRRKHQVCGMSASGIWAMQTWCPAGDVTATELQRGGLACPMLLCHGGVSCVRAVHSWSERWWATLHLTRDLSNYERVEVEDMLRLSPLNEWKLCATAWFLSQCVGNCSLSMTLNALRRGSLPSESLRQFVRDIPEHLASHLARCAQCMTSSMIAVELETLRCMLQAACCPEDRQVTVADASLTLLGGFCSEQKQRPFAHLPPSGSTRVCLSDILRGSIAVCECEYLCAAMRDLMLLCIYAAKDRPRDSAEMDAIEGPMQVEDSWWTSLAEVLDEQLPLLASLHRSMQLGMPRQGAGNAFHFALPASLESRGCDMWASTFRTKADGRCLGLRPPAASFKSFQYAMRLLQHECWDAVRWWSRHQPMKELCAYVAGREWVATGRFDLAREAFVHAENVANVVAACVRSSGFGSTFADSSPDVVTYYVHVAELFSSSHATTSDSHFFLKKAAHLAEDGSQRNGTDNSLCQRLWSSVFEKAVHLEMWDEAYASLLRIDAFDSCIRLLGQKLRSSGRIDLMLKLPEKHRTFFMANLYEQASLGPPTAGSDSLACYQSLYALHFAAGEYLKAATIAHSMYSALSRSLTRLLPALTDHANMVTSPGIDRGDCISRPCEVPKYIRQPPLDLPEGCDTSAATADHVWTLLEQQRSALLMLISALSLTPEKTMLVLPPHPSSASSSACCDLRASEGTGAAKRLGAALGMAPGEFSSFRSWFAEAKDRARAATFTVADAERLLSIAEAHMILSGRTELCTPSDVAHSVAALGLLGLALRVTRAYSLDAWQFAFQPFLRLCTETEGCADAKVMALVDAARGPAQAYMFHRSDGHDPLGTSGSARGGWWQTLEESLRAVSGPRTNGHQLDAAGTRLYSLAADHILSHQRTNGRLSRFIAKALTGGPAWVCLLRLYMKYERMEDAVELLGEQLKSCKLHDEPTLWSPLRDFPVSLVVQLKRYVSNRAQEEKSGDISHLATVLDAILAQFQDLLEDTERRMEQQQ